MQKIMISIPLPLMEQIENFIGKCGYQSKAEFFRHAAFSYLERYERMLAGRKAGVNVPFHSI